MGTPTTSSQSTSAGCKQQGEPCNLDVPYDCCDGDCQLTFDNGEVDIKCGPSTTTASTSSTSTPTTSSHSTSAGCKQQGEPCNLDVPNDCCDGDCQLTFDNGEVDIKCGPRTTTEPTTPTPTPTPTTTPTSTPTSTPANPT